MRYIKTYEGLFDFLKKKKPEKGDILKKILNRVLLYPDEQHVPNYTINPDETVDVNGKVDLGSITNEYIELLKKVKFRNIYGHFIINRIPNLKYLPESCPDYVSNDFMCGKDDLISLKNSPKEVGDDFDCSDNKLSTLEYCPEKIGSSFYFQNNNIYNFDFFPKVIGAQFYCENNPIYNLCVLFLSIGQIHHQHNGGFDMDYRKIEMFNAYDPTRPPEEGDKPILYLDVLSLFLDEYKVTDKHSIDDIDNNFNIYTNNIFNCYKVMNSNGSICTPKEIAKVIMSIIR
jgi:hypothetical protein